MTEKMTPERSALLLADASRVINRKLDEWPKELQPAELAALLAGTRRGDAFKAWRTRIRQAIEAAPPLLAVRTDRKPPGSSWVRGTTPQSILGRKPARPWGCDAYGQATFTESSALERHHIAAGPAADWLHAAGVTLTDPHHAPLLAWLGPAWVEDGAGDTAPKVRSQERRDRLTVATKAALIALRKKGMPSPTAGDVFDYLAEHDETGTIEDSTDDKLTWRTSEGHLNDTSRKSLANRLTRLRRKSPA